MVDVKQIKGEIVFEKVDFRYEDHLPLVLEDINIRINKEKCLRY